MGHGREAQTNTNYGGRVEGDEELGGHCGHVFLASPADINRGVSQVVSTSRCAWSFLLIDLME